MPILLAVIPLVAYLVVVMAAGGPEDFIGAVPFLALMVSMPTLIPLAAARRPTLRYVVAGVLTCVAVIAALLPILTNGEQTFAIFLVPMAAVGLAVVVRVGPALFEHRWSGDWTTTELFPASIGDRLAALAVDVAVFVICVGLPLRYFKDSGRQSVSLLLAVAVGTAYLAASVHWAQRTIGHRVMGLAVLREDDLGPVSLPRAIGRALVITIEVVGGVVVLLAPIAMAELFAAAWYGGRTITDRLFGTLVVTRQPGDATEDAPVSAGR